MSRALKYTAIASLSIAVVTFLTCATMAGLHSLGIGGCIVLLPFGIYMGVYFDSFL